MRARLGLYLALAFLPVAAACGILPIGAEEDALAVNPPTPTVTPLSEPGAPPPRIIPVVPQPTPTHTPTFTPTPLPTPTPSTVVVSSTFTPTPAPTELPTPTVTPTPSPTPTPTPTPLPPLGFENVKVFTNSPSQVQVLFSLKDPDGRSIILPTSEIRDATRIFERGFNTDGWEEIDYLETNFVVHSTENFRLEVVFVLDFSRSVSEAQLSGGRTGSDAMQSAFRTAVNSLPAAHRVGVVELHDRNAEPVVLSALTTDRVTLLDDVNLFALSEFEPGSSRVWDSVQTAINLFTRPQDNPDVVKALVFVTDGRDTSSVSQRDDVAELAAEEGIQLYALGIGDVFDEAGIREAVALTGGEYYETNQFEVLQSQLEKIITDLRGQYRVSYITLRRQGLYETRVEVAFSEAAGSVITAAEEVATFYGPDNRGVISVDTPSLDKETAVATVFIRALHMPRNVRHIRFQMTTLKEVDLDLVSEKDGGILSGWSLFGPDQQGFYDAFGPGPLDFGNFGLLFKATFLGVEEKTLEVPISLDNTIYSPDKTLSGPGVFYIGQRLPASGRIAFRSTRDGDSEIYIVNAAGGRHVNFTDDPADDFLATWSIDGSTIAFDSNRDHLTAIFLIDQDGENLRKITPGSSGNSLPAWSNSSGRIAFVSDRDFNREI